MSRMPSLMAATMVAAGALVSAQVGARHSFDGDPAGRLPVGFSVAAFRQTAPGAWVVGHVGAQGFLTHVSDPNAHGWSVALTPAAPLGDLVASARVRLVEGTRAGGLVWRYQDPANFHAVLLDLSRKEIATYRVVAGNRFRDDVEDDLDLDPLAWHTLKVSQSGGESEVSLGGIRVFRDNDRRREHPAPGQVGVIAAGDAEAWFDDVRVEPKRSR